MERVKNDATISKVFNIKVGKNERSASKKTKKKKIKLIEGITNDFNEKQKNNISENIQKPNLLNLERNNESKKEKDEEKLLNKEVNEDSEKNKLEGIFHIYFLKIIFNR